MGDPTPKRLLLYALAVCLGPLYLAAGATAAPTTLAVDEPQPPKEAHILIVTTYSGSSTFDVTGTIDADIVVSSGGVATGLDLQGADLALSDATIVIDVGTPFPAYFQLVDVTATLSGPAAVFAGTDGVTSVFDLEGSQLVFDSGYAGLWDPWSGTSNYLYFSQNPVAFVYGPGATAEVTVTSFARDEAAVSLSLPLDLSVVDPTGSPDTVTFSMSGDLEASGTVIPEPPTPVDIDIRPWSERNLVFPFSRQLISVALLGADGFDVAQVDATTLAFGPAMASPAFDPTDPALFRLTHRDVNGDGEQDLVSHYRMAETGIAIEDTEACLGGNMLDGTAFEGCDAVKTALGCGHGFEAALVVPPLVWIGGRVRRRRL